MKSLERMIDRAAKICGSKSEVARRLGVSPQTLYNWETARRSMPDEQIDALATLTGYDPIKALGEYHHEWMRKKTGGSARAGIAVALSFLVAASSAVSGLPQQSAHASRDLLLTHYAQLVAWMRQLRLIASSLGRDGRPNHAPTCSQETLSPCRGGWLAMKGSDVA